MKQYFLLFFVFFIAFQSIQAQVEIKNSCSPEILRIIEETQAFLDQQKSQLAFQKIIEIDTAKTLCSRAMEWIGWAYFRVGNWEKGMDWINRGIEKFPRDMHLIKRRGYLQLEMAELGENLRMIDGNTIEIESKTLKSNPEKQKSIYFQLAESDFLSYISMEADPKIIHLLGYISQQLNKPKKAIYYYESLRSNPIYEDDVTLTLKEIYFSQKDWTNYEKMLHEIEEKYPRNLINLEESIEFYRFLKKEEQVKIYQQKIQFYTLCPDFLAVPFSSANSYNWLLIAYKHKTEFEKNWNQLESDTIKTKLLISTLFYEQTSPKIVHFAIDNLLRSGKNYSSLFLSGFSHATSQKQKDQLAILIEKHGTKTEKLILFDELKPTVFSLETVSLEAIHFCRKTNKKFTRNVLSERLTDYFATKKWESCSNQEQQSVIALLRLYPKKAWSSTDFFIRHPEIFLNYEKVAQQKR
jgi:tetratricopeptide (TPR) repeat protein